jgi:hypothetical protein
MADAAEKAVQVTITTPIFRTSYPNLDKPSKMEGSASDPKYGVTGLFTATSFTPQDAERWKKMRQAAVASLREKFGDKAFGADRKILPAYKMPFRDGMEKPDKDGYGAGVTFIRMGNKTPPGMIQMIGGAKTKIDWSKFYAGCYARASVSFWSFDNKSKGVAVNLHNLIFIGDGEKFGNQGPDAENDFTDLGEDEISFGDDAGGDAFGDDDVQF